METNNEFDRGQWDVLSLKKGRCEEGLVVFWDPGFWVLSVVACLPTEADKSIIYIYVSLFLSLNTTAANSFRGF